MKTKQNENTIIRLDRREEVDKAGRTIAIYRRRVFRPGDPDYEKEKANKEAFEVFNSGRLLGVK